MTAFDIVLVVHGAIIALTTLTVVYRMIVGPTILDRAISTDMLVVLIAIGMALYTAHAQAEWAGPAMLSLTGLAFIGTVTFARFVAREEPMQGRRRIREEPETTTGPLQAIHLDHEGRTPEPDNVLMTPDPEADASNDWLDEEEIGTGEPAAPPVAGSDETDSRAPGQVGLEAPAGDEPGSRPSEDEPTSGQEGER